MDRDVFSTLLADYTLHISIYTFLNVVPETLCTKGAQMQSTRLLFIRYYL